MHNDKESAARAFVKKCPHCGHIWADRAEFLGDPEVEVKGYQANFKELSLGFFLFNHNDCHTTLAIYAEEFRDLYAGPVFTDRRTGKDDCQGLCLHTDELGMCRAKCECAFVREVLQVVRNWPKELSRSSSAPAGA